MYLYLCNYVSLQCKGTSAGSEVHVRNLCSTWKQPYKAYTTGSPTTLKSCTPSKNPCKYLEILKSQTCLASSLIIFICKLWLSSRHVLLTPQGQLHWLWHWIDYGRWILDSILVYEEWCTNIITWTSETFY